jgi:hypothetical protein
VTFFDALPADRLEAIPSNAVVAVVLASFALGLRSAWRAARAASARREGAAGGGFVPGPAIVRGRVKTEEPGRVIRLFKEHADDAGVARSSIEVGDHVEAAGELFLERRPRAGSGFRDLADVWTLRGSPAKKIVISSGKIATGGEENVATTRIVLAATATLATGGGLGLLGRWVTEDSVS